MRIIGALLLLSVPLLALSPALPAQEPTKKELLAAFERQLKAAGDAAGPCVGCVVVSRSDRYPMRPNADQPGKLGDFNKAEFDKAHPNEGEHSRLLDLSDPRSVADHGAACGVVIDTAGLVLTPYHVVAGATKVYVHLPGRVGSYADIHAADARHDLAVLKLISPPKGLTAIKFANVRLAGLGLQQETLFPGKVVFLVANSYAAGFGIDRPSAKWGEVTLLRWTSTDKKDARETYYNYGPILEHDAKLGAEVSGAALVNLDGEMVGLTTSAAGLSGGLAFPVDAGFRRVVEALRRGEEVEYGYLGVTLGVGLTVDQLAPQSPAALAGIREGGRITHADGVRIGTYGELLIRVGSALAGTKVKLTVIQDGRAQDFDVTLGKFDHGQPFIASSRPEPVFGLRVDHNSVLAQRERSNAQIQSAGVPPGVSVRELVTNSPAAGAFKKLGDRPERWVVTHVNGNPVATPAEFYKAAKGQQSVKLTVKDPTVFNSREREVTLP